MIPSSILRRDKIIGGSANGGHVKSILESSLVPLQLIYEKDFISNEKDLFGVGSRYRTA